VKQEGASFGVAAHEDGLMAIGR